MSQILIPATSFAAIVAALADRIEAANYLAPEKYDDPEHEEEFRKADEQARAALGDAHSYLPQELSEEEGLRRAKIIDLAIEQHGMGEDCDVDSDAIVSEGDDNGCYVSAWVWVNFEGTDLDKETESTTESCQGCCGDVDEEEPYHATPCGTYCHECMRKHVQSCGVCADEFADDFDPSDQPTV
jgi:hypothetical protein